MIKRNPTFRNQILETKNRKLKYNYSKPAPRKAEVVNMEVSGYQIKETVRVS